MIATDVRQAALVTYKLRGERIKAALLMNPGAIIIAPRQSGKSMQLAEYVVENHPDGAIVFCMNQASAEFFRDLIPKGYFKQSIIVWGTQNPSLFRGGNLPIYADELCFHTSAMQEAIVRDARFCGAVSSANSVYTVVDEVRNRCIPY